MARTTEINIEGYRGIKSLHLDNLQRVNVLLGNNNCGKSSLLEAILIMMGESKPTLPIEMNLDRNYQRQDKKDIALFFHNLDTSAPIHIAAKFEDNRDRDLSIKYFEKSKNVKFSDFQNKALNTEPIFPYGLRFEYKLGDTIFNSNIEFCEGTSRAKYSISKKENTPSGKAIYIAPRYNFDGSISSFNKIITEKEKDGLVEVLRHIEPKIKDVVAVDNVVMVDVGLKQMIPINFLGDGIRKLFTLIIAMYDARGGILLIDEVDNGMYYTSTEILWKMLLNASKELNVQVFVTTHSIDMLDSLNSILTDELTDSQSDVNIYTLRKELNDEVSAYLYGYSAYSHVLNQGVDIR